MMDRATRVHVQDATEENKHDQLQVESGPRICVLTIGRCIYTWRIYTPIGMMDLCPFVMEPRLHITY